MKKNLLVCGALLAALAAAACTGAGAKEPVQPAQAAVPSATEASAAPAPAAARSRNWSWSDQKMRYTKADYELLQSFQLKDYESMSVADFNAGVLDWTDEDAFHKTEDALTRLRWSLPDQDPLSPFLDTVISHTWNECELKHYNACKRNTLPSADGCAAHEKYADVYGDQVLIAGGYADFWYDYEMPDESKVTVAQREAFIKGIEDGMQAFLDKQTEDAMKQDKTMETALQAELERLIQSLSSDKIKASGAELSYCWERMY